MFGPLAKLFVEIGAITRPLDIALAGMQARLSGLASTRMMISPMGFGLALRGVDAMFDGLQHVLKAGSELNEATNKMGVVFGDQAGVVGAAADMMADKYGVVKKQYIDMASEYGNLLQGMGGQTRQEAAMMSNVLSKVAADATSVFDTKDFAEAGAKIASGLRGMSLPMSKYGADTQRTAVAQEALRLGLAQNVAALTMHDKVVARTSLMLQDMGYASGDLDNTLTSYANATRAAEGRMENLAATIGQQILPAFEEMMALVNEVLIDFTTSHDGMTSVLQTFAGFVKSAVQTIGVVYRNFGTIVEYVGAEINGYMTNIGETVSWLGDVFRSFLDWFGTNWRTIFADALNAVVTMLGNLGENIIRFGEALWEAIKSGFTKPFEVHFVGIFDGIENQTPRMEIPALKLTSFADQLKEIADKMNQVEQAHADAVAGRMPEPRGQRQRRPESSRSNGKSEYFDFVGFNRMIQSSLKPDRTAERTEANTRQAVRALQQNNAAIQENTAATRAINVRQETLANHLKKIEENTGKRNVAVAG